MTPPLEAFIALRYTRARRKSQFVSFISVMTTLGIVLGVAAMITVLSVMNGFGRELQHRVLGVVSHVTIEGISGHLTGWKTLAGQVSQRPGVMAWAPYIDGQGMLVRGRQASGVVVRGIAPEQEQEVSTLGDKLVAGKLADLKPGGQGVILGQTLAQNLNAKVGDRVVLVQNTQEQGRLLPRLHRFTVTGLLHVGMHRQDSAMVLMHIDDAARVFRMGGTISGLRFKLEDAWQAPEMALAIEGGLGPQYSVNHWMARHRNFFIALEDQKRIMYIVLLLVVSVAAFNIVSTLVMMVTDKQSDIAILRTMGMTPGGVMRVFMLQGTMIAGIGIALGVVLGLLIAANTESIVHFIERLLDMNFLSPDVYPITDLPSWVQWQDLVSIVSATLFISFLSTLYPAWRAARTRPAEALRYE